MKRMRKWERSPAAHLLLLGILLLPACNSIDSGSSFANRLPPLDLPSHVDPYPDDQVLQVAKTRFAEGNYGYAARYYERAVEVAPKDGEAWLGLAASYDRVRRFDLADRAYREAGKYLGNRAEYYNDVGYSYLLRGDVARAQSQFLRAHELDPTNRTINNNLEMLRETLARQKQG